MNNSAVLTLVDECKNELQRIEQIIIVLTSTNPAVPFLTKYAIIKTCGTLEQCFKIIITDFCNHSQTPQARKYINQTFRENSMNPNLDNVYKSLLKFDENWHRDFKRMLNSDSNNARIKNSISSLNNARNQFAHGGNPNTTFNDVKSYFTDAEKIISMLDSIIHI